MGFALWIEGPLAWAQGLHEYRPMGVAVISVTDLFRPRDFRLAPPERERAGPGYVGLFASLGQMNDYLARRRDAAGYLIQRTDRGRRRPRGYP